VRYVVEGSVRRSENRIRITGQLVDASAGTHLWAERFEGTLDDIFELQDQIAKRIVGAIASQLERAEIERARRKPTGNLSAYDNYLRAMPHLHRGTRDAISEALPLFCKAMQLDREFASAHAMSAWCHFWRKINGWMTDRSQEIAEGVRLARLAVELGKDDAVALTRGGHALAHLAGEVDGRHRADRQGVWCSTPIWRQPGSWAAFSGRCAVTPMPPSSFLRAPCVSARSTRRCSECRQEWRCRICFAGRFDTASSWAEQSFREAPTFLAVVAIIAASHALAGRTEQARTPVEHLRKLDPTFRISSLQGWIPIRRPEHLARFETGLRLAGLPE